MVIFIYRITEEFLQKLGQNLIFSFEKLNRELSTVTWPDNNGDIELSVSHFNQTITHLFEKYVAIVVGNKSTNPWFLIYTHLFEKYICK